MPKRILVGYGVDVDAAAGWLNTNGTPANPTNISRGIFGATTGVDRLLSLFDRHNIKATFFIPGHTIESFPSQMARVRDSGHELALHGYTHEHPSQLTQEQEVEVLEKSIEVLTNFDGGKKPRGYTAPAWATSKHTIVLLQASGIAYDHSFMHHDFQPYWAPDPAQTTYVETDFSQKASSWMKPMSTLKASNVVEIPANWHVDDWPPLQPSPGRAGSHGYVDVESVERCWKEQFEFAYEEYDEFVFPISIHPQVSGKGHVIRMHERFIQWVNSHEGEIIWMPLEKMAEEFREGRITGVKIEGGVGL